MTALLESFAKLNVYTQRTYRNGKLVTALLEKLTKFYCNLCTHRDLIASIFTNRNT